MTEEKERRREKERMERMERMERKRGRKRTREFCLSYLPFDSSTSYVRPVLLCSFAVMLRVLFAVPLLPFRALRRGFCHPREPRCAVVRSLGPLVFFG